MVTIDAERAGVARGLTVLLATAMSFYIGCGESPRKEHDMSKEAAFKVAADYIRIVRPAWKEALSLPHEVTDKGDYWLVTFVLPEDQIGGVPVLHVDKKDNLVVKAFHEQ